MLGPLRRDLSVMPRISALRGATTAPLVRGAARAARWRASAPAAQQAEDFEQRCRGAERARLLYEEIGSRVADKTAAACRP